MIIDKVKLFVSRAAGPAARLALLARRACARPQRMIMTSVMINLTIRVRVFLDLIAPTTGRLLRNILLALLARRACARPQRRRGSAGRKARSTAAVALA
jgi:hypothetical protein